VLARLASTSTVDADTGPIQFPHFVFDHISHQFGLKHIVMQTCWDLVFNLEVHRESYPTAELFSKFLGELYGSDDLLFFLYMRNLFQNHFGLQLHTKEILAANPSERVQLPPEQSVALVPHPTVLNGSQTAYLTRDAVRHALCTFLHDDVAEFVTAQLLREAFVPVEGFGAAPLMEVQALLLALLDNYRKTPEEITRKMKFGESKESTQQLKALQDTVRNAKERKALAEALAHEQQLLAEARVALAQLERDNADGSKRTAVFLARNHAWKKEQDVAEARKRCIAAERAENEVWNTVMEASPAVVGGRRTNAARGKGKGKGKGKRDQKAGGAGGAGGAGTGGTRRLGAKTKRRGGGGRSRRAAKKPRRFCEVDSVDLAMERCHVWLSEQYRRFRLQLKFVNAMQNTWKKRLEDLKIRAVIRIQRGFRARKARQEAHRRGQEELERRRIAREKARKANAEIMKRREADAAERKRLLDKAEERLQAEARRKAKRKRALERKRRKQYAELQYKKYRKRETRHRFTRWTAFVKLSKRQRKVQGRIKRKRFNRWRGFTRLNKFRRDAAKKIQSVIRMFMAKRCVCVSCWLGFGPGSRSCASRPRRVGNDYPHRVPSCVRVDTAPVGFWCVWLQVRRPCAHHAQENERQGSQGDATLHDGFRLSRLLELGRVHPPQPPRQAVHAQPYAERAVAPVRAVAGLHPVANGRQAVRCHRSAIANPWHACATPCTEHARPTRRQPCRHPLLPLCHGAHAAGTAAACQGA